VAEGAGVWIRPFRGDQHRVYFRLEPGGKLHGSRGFPTAEAAEDLAAELRSKITTKRRTVDDAIESYKADLDARALRNEVRPERGARLAHLLRRLMAGALKLPLGSLTARRCDELYKALADTPGVAVGTHQKCLKDGRGWGEWCVQRGWYKTSPWAKVKRLGQSDDSRNVSLRVNEARKYRDAALRLAGGGDEGALTALIALSCSLRPSEIVQLAARDVDDDGALLWVAGKRLKTKNTRRSITIADEELRQLLVERARGLAPDALLFDHDRGFVTDAAKRVAAVAKVPVVDARGLRRTFATLDARRGSSLDAVAFGMGHGADVKAATARQHYIAPGAVETGAAKRVMRVLDGGKAAKAKRGA
jgi:integrase